MGPYWHKATAEGIGNFFRWVLKINDLAVVDILNSASVATSEKGLITSFKVFPKSKIPARTCMSIVCRPQFT